MTKATLRSLALLPFVFVAVNLAAQGPQIQLRRIISGLDQPVAITHAGDSRIFITQQTGRVLIYDGTQILPTPFLNVASLISCCGERGLLSVAFHPRYRDNGRFFIDYTDRNGDIVIARYTVSSNPNVADAASGTIILKISHPVNSNHNGGQLQFGPDGFLYAGTGDGGAGGDPPNNAQNTNVLLGKLLRIDVDSASTYAIPQSNPFVGMSNARPEIWAYGLRNPWRFSFDRENGDLWIGDVGQNDWEEIDFQPVTSIGGENYGWRRMEGTHCYNPSSGCATANLTAPIAEYSHAFGCSVTGGYRYRGAQFRRMQGLYFYGDYCSGTIWAIAQQANGTFNSSEVLSTDLAISTFGEDVNGELYVADLNAGAVYQVIDALPFVSPPRRRAARPLAERGAPGDLAGRAARQRRHSVHLEWSCAKTAASPRHSRRGAGARAISLLGFTRCHRAARQRRCATHSRTTGLRVRWRLERRRAHVPPSPESTTGSASDLTHR
ncbi:MAG: PQQ-dependent sugar dehydrogenase [Thermoanaerobaculia bacterium]